MTPSPPLVVLTDRTDLDPEPARKLLHAAGFRTLLLDLRVRRTVPEEARSAVAAIVGFARIDDEILAQLPALRLICTSSAGTDMVDAAATARRGVEVIGLSDASTNEVAVHALTLALASLRRIPDGAALAAGGGWTDSFGGPPRAPETLTIGLLGLGRIARRLVDIARPIFGSVIAHDPFVHVPGVENVGLDELWARSDVLSLHVPVTGSTRGIVSADVLARLPPDALLVNAARAELVDEEAVCAALDAGALAGYAADVLAGEPPRADHPLRTHPRALVSPHVAFLSEASLRRYQEWPARTIITRLCS